MNEGQWKRPKSLKRSLILFMVFSWVIPIIIFAVFIFTSYRNIYLDKIDDLIESGLISSAILVSARLDESIRLIQKPSYEREWEKEWKKYDRNGTEVKTFLELVNNSLKNKYYMDETFDLYAFYLVSEEEPRCYSSRIGYGYDDYMTLVQPQIVDDLKSDSDYVEVKVVDNQVYLIRNLYTVSGYQKYGSLVVALNTKEIFDGFPMEQIENVGICFNAEGELLFSEAKASLANEKAKTIYKSLQGIANVASNNVITKTSNSEYEAYMYESRKDNYHVGIRYIVDKEVALANLHELYRITVAMLLTFIPIIIFAFRYLQKQIEIPLERLVKVSKTIMGGNIGTIVEGKPMPNMEFEYLVQSFNNMSEQVKYLFDSAYNEKLARKDAQIAALQAQINPHFLNNTLEMMNWQARMSNDIVVCKMIEALGTVLDHSMNRDNRKEIYLSEEIRSADAYLYIMTMRFGQRLQVEKEIDESLLWINVPQLILQPIIENAILHGIERVKTGKIKIHIYHDEVNIYLDIINTGKEITQATIAQAEAIISGKILEGSGKHTSIGLRNVNTRIKLTYGEKYGLTVAALEGEKFLSRITLPLERLEQEKKAGE